MKFSHAFSAHGFFVLNQETRNPGKRTRQDLEDKMKTEHSNGAASANPAVTDAEQRPGFPNPLNLASKLVPNSRKVYGAGKKYVDLRVPFREISLAPTKSMNGEI